MQYSQKYFSDKQFLLYAWFEAMHTRIDLAICSEAGSKDILELVSEIENEIKKIENIGNRFSSESELSYVNENAFNKEVIISSELCKILSDCQYFNEETLGYFDITVGYFFVGCSGNSGNFVLNTEKNTIRFLVAGLQLDLSGFIKGYALGKIMHILSSKGFENVLVNIGNSSVLALGNHPFGEGWKIRTPATEQECTLRNECLTTSGNTDSSIWPIINPKNGEIPINKQSISVITSDPAVGEVLSKVAYLAKENELKKILINLNGRILN